MATLVPLAFVVILGIIKEAIVEYRRYREDKKFNATPTRQVTFEAGKIKQTIKRLDEVHVGDILEFQDDEAIPADCIIIWAEDPKGKAYI